MTTERQMFAEWLAEELSDTPDMFADEIQSVSMSREQMQESWREWELDREEQVDGGSVACYVGVQGEFGGQRKSVYIADINGQRMGYSQ